MKLQLDLECQRRAEEVILGAYPDHAILGEEGGAGASDGRPVWVVDPIDGTVNFSHGLPYWCTSIAVQVAGRTLAGVVYAPDLREVYAASVEVPATCNGQPIAVSDTAELGGVLAYDMIADSPEAIAAMQEMGQPLSHKTKGRFSAYWPYERLSLTHLIDFVPGQPHYETVIDVDFYPEGKMTRMVVTLHPHLDPEWTKMSAEGFGSQLTKLDQRYG